MTYSVGGLIEATDYNGFVSTTAGANINATWSTGTTSAGYGQTALATVSSAGTVTATQWASAVNTLNSLLTHQSGSGSGIGAPTAGSVIAYLSTFQTNINTGYTNRLNASTNGTDITGTAPAAATWNSAPYRLQTYRAKSRFSRCSPLAMCCAMLPINKKCSMAPSGKKASNRCLSAWASSCWPRPTSAPANWCCESPARSTHQRTSKASSCACPRPRSGCF